MTADAFIFWFLAIVTVCSGLSVVLLTNPIFCALCLAMTMVGVSALFVTLGAYFLAGVQLIVYAGAVMVLFVMVLMLFDLKTELKAFSKGAFSTGLKITVVGCLAGLLMGAIVSLTNLATLAKTQSDKLDTVKPIMTDSIRSLGINLFTKQVFAFEAMGVLLLVVAIGTVALSRSKGGTHVK